MNRVENELVEWMGDYELYTPRPTQTGCKAFRRRHLLKFNLRKYIIKAYLKQDFDSYWISFKPLCAPYEHCPLLWTSVQIQRWWWCFPARAGSACPKVCSPQLLSPGPAFCPEPHPFVDWAPPLGLVHPLSLLPPPLNQLTLVSNGNSIRRQNTEPRGLDSTWAQLTQKEHPRPQTYIRGTGGLPLPSAVLYQASSASGKPSWVLVID